MYVCMSMHAFMWYVDIYSMYVNVVMYLQVDVYVCMYVCMWRRMTCDHHDFGS